MSKGLLLFVTIDLSGAELTPFEEYEARVLALLPEHSGRLLHRFRVDARQSEHHLISFADRVGYESYMADGRRLAIRHLWDGSGAVIRVDEARTV